MHNIATHMRIAGLSVTNDDVNSATEAARELAESWSKQKDPAQTILKAAEVARSLHGDGIPTPILGKEAEVAIQKNASAFLCVEKPLYIGICAGVAAIELMAKAALSADGSLAADTMAVALWSALGFQPSLPDAKREALRSEVMHAACDRAMQIAEHARKRGGLGELTEVTAANGDSESNTCLEESHPYPS